MVTDRIKYQNVAYNGSKGCLLVCSEKAMFRPDDSKTAKAWRWELIDHFEAGEDSNGCGSLDRVIRIVPKKAKQKTITIMVPRHIHQPLLKDLRKRLRKNQGSTTNAAKPSSSTTPSVKKVAEKTSTKVSKQSADNLASKRNSSLPELGIRVSAVGDDHPFHHSIAAIRHDSPKRTYLPDDMGIRVSATTSPPMRRSSLLDDGIRVSGSNSNYERTTTTTNPKKKKSPSDLSYGMGIRVTGSDHVHQNPIRKAFSRPSGAEKGSKKVTQKKAAPVSPSSKNSNNDLLCGDGIRVIGSDQEKETPRTRRSKLSAMIGGILSSPAGTSKEGTAATPKSGKSKCSNKKSKRVSLSGFKPKMPPLFHRHSDVDYQPENEQASRRNIKPKKKAAVKTPKRPLVNFLKSSGTQAKNQAEKKEKAAKSTFKGDSIWTPDSGHDSSTAPSTPSARRGRLSPGSPSQRSSNSGNGACSIISEETVPGFNPEWSPSSPENQTRLTVFRHAAACACRNGRCDMDPKCSHHKKILDHMDHCSNTDCGYPECTESKQFLTVMQILMQEPQAVKNGEYDDFLVQVGALVPVAQIKFANKPKASLRKKNSFHLEYESDDDDSGSEYESGSDDDGDDDEKSMSSESTVLSLDEISDLGSWGVLEDEYDGEDPWMSFQVPSDKSAFDIF